MVDLITPNIPEAEHLLGMEIATPADIEAAAQKAITTGVKEVLINGGHGFHDMELSSDYWSDGKNHAWLSSPRLDTKHSHGTGYILSSAIATARAPGYSPLGSIIVAKGPTSIRDCVWHQDWAAAAARWLSTGVPFHFYPRKEVFIHKKGTPNMRSALLH